MADTATAASGVLEQRAVRKITLTMNTDIGLTSQMFGLGAGIFSLVLDWPGDDHLGPCLGRDGPYSFSPSQPPS